MGMLGLRVPHETARILSEIEVPGEPEPEGHFHITLIYIGDKVPIEVLVRAIVPVYSVSSTTVPFNVSTAEVTSFPANKEGKTPVICRVESDGIFTFRQRLCDALDIHGVEYDKKFPQYRPHVTLSYADEAVDPTPIPRLSWGAHEAVLWGGDEGDRRLIVAFPLSLGADISVTKTAKRVQERFMAALGS
jgi:2'-5' RNA ligase